jgi:hypothetical protein
MKITEEICNKFNKVLHATGVGFYYIFQNEDTRTPIMKVAVVDNNLGWVDSSIVNLTDKYFKFLETWFITNYGITIRYNNTRSIIWSDDYT